MFHTFFGLTALSLMGNYELNMIDHTYAIPVDTMREAFPHLSVASESEQDNSQADGTSVEQTD